MAEEEDEEQEAPKRKYAQYSAGEVTDVKTGVWIPKQEWIFDLDIGEFPILWASMMIRLKYVSLAEETYPNYQHRETFSVDGKNEILAIGSGLKPLREPILINFPHKGNTPETKRELSERVVSNQRWRMKKDTGEQAIASIGWYCDIVKAKPPAITRDETSTTYRKSLLPSNLKKQEIQASTGYNKQQTALLKEGQDLVIELMAKTPTVQKQWEDMGVVIFGQYISKLRDKIFSSLPDPEEEERKKLEEIKERAKEIEDPD